MSKRRRTSVAVVRELVYTSFVGSDHFVSHCMGLSEDACFSNTDYIDFPHLKLARFGYSDPTRSATLPHLVALLRLILLKVFKDRGLSIIGIIKGTIKVVLIRLTKAITSES